VTGIEQHETVLVRVARDHEDLTAKLSGLERVHHVERRNGGYRIRLDREGDAREAVARTVFEAGLGLVELSRHRASLEEVFLHLVTEESEGGDA
jgi:hypothetical protein